MTEEVREQLTNFYLTGLKYHVDALALAVKAGDSMRIYLCDYSQLCERLEQYDLIDDKMKLKKMDVLNVRDLRRKAFYNWLNKQAILYNGEVLASGEQMEQVTAKALNAKAVGNLLLPYDIETENGRRIEVKGLRANIIRPII